MAYWDKAGRAQTWRDMHARGGGSGSGDAVKEGTYSGRPFGEENRSRLGEISRLKVRFLPRSPLFQEDTQNQQRRRSRIAPKPAVHRIHDDGSGAAFGVNVKSSSAR